MGEDKILVICEKCLDEECSVIKQLRGVTASRGSCQCPCHGRKQEIKTIEEIPPHHAGMLGMLK